MCSAMPPVIKSLKMATSSTVTAAPNLFCKTKAVESHLNYFGLRADAEGRMLKSTVDCLVKLVSSPSRQKVAV